MAGNDNTYYVFMQAVAGEELELYVLCIDDSFERGASAVEFR